MADSNPIKRIFDLYTSDLSYQEIEKLVKREASEVYEFFKAEIPKPDPHQNKFSRGLVFIRSLFNAFIMKLPPARRIFYLISLLFFSVGFINGQSFYLFSGFAIVNLLLAFELADKLSAKSELDVARKIQFDLIPKHESKIYNYEVATFYEPARDVGGDYFDIVETPDRTFVIIGDISGKGMAAALYMVRVQSIFYQLIDSYSDVKDIIINLKKYFSKNLRREFFLTVTVASIEKDGTINIARAGHPPAFLYKKNINDFSVINSAGMGIGLNDKGLFEKTLEVITLKPEQDDILFLYSDGVTETMNIVRDLFGDENVKRIIKNNHDKSAEEIKMSLLRSITAFRGTAYPNDDLTMVVLKSAHSSAS